MDAHQLDLVLLAATSVLLVAILAVRLSVGVGLPSLLAYLAIGVLLGESGLGFQFDNADTAHALGFAALIVILAEGGLTTKWSEVRPALPVGISLATVGVTISVVVVAVFAHWLLGLSWELSVLLGATTSATDAAAVFSVLRTVPLKTRLRGILEAESGLNDAPTVLLVALVSAGNALDHGPVGFAGIVAYELIVGSVAGGLVGLVGAWVMRGVALPASGLYPLAVMAFAVFAYAGTVALHASGFAAVYVAGVVLGNSELPHRAATRSFAEGLAWLAQIGLFVMLGLLASPGRFELSHLTAGLAAGLVLTFVARPLSVLACGVPAKLPRLEQAFVAWAGLRGAVPIVLTTIPLAEGVAHSDDLFDMVLVVVFTLVQGPTLPAMARHLGVVTTGEARDIDIEAAPLDHVAADLLQVTITPQSRLHGVAVSELRLPVGVAVSLVVRDGVSFVPERHTTLKRADEMLVVTPRRLRDETEKRLRAVSRKGRLAGWFGEGGRLE